MGRELEWKFAATEAAQTAVREKYPGFSPIEMETVYYDTPCAALSARRATLRRRSENGRSVCTLKLPLPDGSRGEWETECESIEAATPMLCKLGCPAELLTLTAEGLTEVCGARFTRLAANIVLPDCAVEVALDRGFLLGGSRQQPLCELEVEYKSGSETAARVFALALAAEFGLMPEEKSKFQRAISLAKGEK